MLLHLKNIVMRIKRVFNDSSLFFHFPLTRLPKVLLLNLSLLKSYIGFDETVFLLKKTFNWLALVFIFEFFCQELLKKE